MSEQTPGRQRIRAGDADREATVASLQRHREAGRLTAEEFEQRMDTALRAVWLDELPPLLADLPRDEATTGRTGRGWRGSDEEWAAARERWPGGPPWAARGRGPCGPAPWGVFGLLLPLLVIGLVVGSIAAVAHGFFPFPLIWLVLIALWWRPWRWRSHPSR